MDDFYVFINEIDVSNSEQTKRQLVHAEEHWGGSDSTFSSKKTLQKVLAKLEGVIRHTVSLKGLCPSFFVCTLF